MLTQKNRPLFFAIGLLAAAAIACGGGTEEFVIITEEPTAGPAPTTEPAATAVPDAGAADPADGKGAERGNLGGGAAATPLPTVAPGSGGELNPQQGTGGLVGNYSVTGVNTEGGSYSGTATITGSSDFFLISWDIGETITNGQGIQLGNSFLVGYPTPGCSVSAYNVGPNGSLDGLWILESDGTNSESATPTSDAVGLLPSNYSVSGTNPDGSTFGGDMTVFAGLDPNLFSVTQTFTESGETIIFQGIAALQNNTLASSYASSNDCGVVNYTINGDGSLSGIWGDTITSTSSSGTESMIPQ